MTRDQANIIKLKNNVIEKKDKEFTRVTKILSILDGSPVRLLYGRVVQWHWKKLKIDSAVRKVAELENYSQENI